MPEPRLTTRAKEMLRILREFQSTPNADAAKYARRAGVRPATFAWWRSRLRSYLDADRQEFVEVKLVAEAPTLLRVSLSSDVVVEVPPGFDPTDVAGHVK